MVILMIVGLMAFAFGFYTSMVRFAVPHEEETSGIPKPSYDLKLVMGTQSDEVEKAA